MSRATTLALKGIAGLLLAIVLLSAIATIVGLAVSVVVTIVSLLVSLLVLGLFVLAIVGLWSLVRDDDRKEVASTDRYAGDRPTAAIDDRDPTERLRERYVAGEIDDTEFERRLDRLLDAEDATARFDRLERGRSSGRDADRSRLRDR